MWFTAARLLLWPERHAPKGPQSSAQSFNPGTDHPERRAPKGRQIESTNNAEVGHMAAPRICASHLRNDGCEIHQFIWYSVALSGRVALGGRSPGLKPWAEFRSPFGAQNKGFSPRIVALALSEHNHPKLGLGSIEGLPRRGHRIQPRVLTLGTLKINDSP
jgi:hypothetical protein